MFREAVCLLVLLVGWGCAGSPAPDTVITNGKVFTSNPAQPWAEAIAISGDRIVAVGDTNTIAAMAGSTTRHIDAGGRTIVPGFNDAHQHIGIAPPHEQLPLPFDAALSQIADALRAQVKTTAAGRWIQGEISMTAWGNPDFTRQWLDGIAPDHPVRLFNFTGHGTLMNSRALAAIGIEEQAADPEGGQYGRDAQGRLDGRLDEYAGYLAGRALALKTEREEAIAAVRGFAAQARSFGITSVQLMATALPAERTSSDLVDADVPLRWKVFRFPMREAKGDTIDSRPVLPPQPSATVDMRGMKWILDGTPIERGAALRSPYADSSGVHGLLNLGRERLDQIAGWAYGSEDPLAVHVVGDAAIDAYVAAVERAGRAEVWQTKRPRIEHGDLLALDLRPRVKALGMVIVQNPMHFMLAPALAARLGPERLSWTQPMKSLLDAGIPLAIGSDGPMNPFLNIMAATVHPANPKEALTREQAVMAYTAGSAFAEFKEKEKGQIAAGMLADLTVLSADVFSVPVEQLEGIRSVMTVFGGRIVHDTGAVR